MLFVRSLKPLDGQPHSLISTSMWFFLRLSIDTQCRVSNKKVIFRLRKFSERQICSLSLLHLFCLLQPLLPDLENKFEVPWILNLPSSVSLERLKSNEKLPYIYNYTFFYNYIVILSRPEMRLHWFNIWTHGRQDFFRLAVREGKYINSLLPGG